MKTAMIFAAGRGSRLKPLTDYIPKAMCLIHNKPLIEHLVENLAQAGFTRLIINHAYLGGKIRQHLGNGSYWGLEICYLPEPPGALETGGAVYSALPLLNNKPFITVNADVFTDYNFSTLYLQGDNLAHFVLAPNPPQYLGDFGLNRESKVTHEKRYTFAGIACYHPRVFQQYKMGRYSVISTMHQLCTNHLASGELYRGLWLNIDSLERLHLANDRSFRDR